MNVRTSGERYLTCPTATVRQLLLIQKTRTPMHSSSDIAEPKWNSRRRHISSLSRAVSAGTIRRLSAGFTAVPHLGAVTAYIAGEAADYAPLSPRIGRFQPQFANPENGSSRWIDPCSPEST